MTTFDATKDLTEKVLKENHTHWTETCRCGDVENRETTHARQAPLTHTFPCEKHWTTGSRNLCSEILDKQQGLLSDQFRESNGLYAADEPRPKMPEARKTGLNNFVFAYLGVHDPFYSRRSNGVPMPAFGLFLKKQHEIFPYCNATRRDLASSQSNFKKSPSLDFLDPLSARQLCTCQVENEPRHKRNFWHYWGAGEFWTAEPEFMENHWHWKFEFHFRDKVPVAYFEAILWPEEKAAGPKGATLRSSWNSSVKQFQERFPSCKVIFYDWDFRQPTKSLIDASTAVTKLYLQTGLFPPFASDALAVFPIGGN